MKKFLLFFLGISLVYLLLGYSEQRKMSPLRRSPQDFSQKDTHSSVILPPGKLPWPHQRPDMTPLEYENLIKDLWIINNYGLYQASEDKSVAYFHDGLDIVLDNGTKLFAIEPGYIKAIQAESPGYYSMIIGDTPEDQPGSGWTYVHVNNFQFLEGAFVNQGDYIADVYFFGLEHVHLSRVYVESGSWKDLSNIRSVHPDKYFVFTDTQPPVIQIPFYYFKNQTDEMFAYSEPPVVRGDVDIVVGMRDPGEFTYSPTYDFGERHCVAKIEYEISGEEIQTIHRKSFDFTKIIIANQADSLGRMRVFTVFKHFMLFYPEFTPSLWNKMFSFYVLTNTDEIGNFGMIDPAAGVFAWHTAEKDELGNPKFPDGLYKITVTAYDSTGNSSTASDDVRVMNVKRTNKKR